MTETGMVLQ